MKGYLHKKGRVWYTTVDLPRHSNGKRRQKEHRLGEGSKAEARAREREVLRNMDDGTMDEPSKATVKDLLEAWLKYITPTEKAQPVAPKTYERYVSIVRNHLVPILGHLSLKDLKTKHVAQMHIQLREKGLSNTTALHVHRVLTTALNVGGKTLNMTKTNPASEVPAPRPSHRQLDVDKDKVIFLIQAARGTRLELLVLLAATSGLRRGELVALKWSAVDLERKRLVVSESLEQTRMFGLRFKQPKSGKMRVVPLADVLVKSLTSHRARQLEIRERLGSRYFDQDLVFCAGDGTPWAPDTLTKDFSSLAQRVGLKGFRLHDLRHAFATISLAQGTSMKEVTELLGHSTPAITMSYYAHTMDGMARDAVNRLTESLVSPQFLAKQCEKM
jgi:integrase